MKITFINREFKFSWFSIVLYLLLIVLLVSLGFWQLGRAEQKEVFLEQQRLSVGKDNLQLTDETDINEVRYRSTVITGNYDKKKQYLIDNQIVNGRAGYFVMTPFYMEGMEKAVLVNRGWVILNQNRQILPDIPVVDTRQTIKGRINRFPVVGIRLAGAEIPTKGWPSVIQLADSKVLSKKLGYALLPFQIELDKHEAFGYQRDWKKKSTMPPEKHIAYAVQWFGLALTLTVLFFGFSRKK